MAELIGFLLPPGARKKGAYKAQFRRLAGEIEKLHALGGCAGKLTLGNRVQALEKAVAKMLGVRHALFVTNATAGFEIAYKFAGLEPGDEVIAPAITFIASIAYPLSIGARVVLADVDPRTINMDPADVAKKITRRTKVIMPQLGYDTQAIQKTCPVAEEVFNRRFTHLPLKTDALIAAHLGRSIGERTGILVAPTIHQSFSGGGLPGTINISPSVMSLVVSDTLGSLAAQGFRNFYLFLCHGGSENARALDNAVKLLLRTSPAFARAMICLLPVWKFGGTGDAEGWARAVRDGDWHAGWLETSMVMALQPELVRMDEMELDPQPLLDLQIAHPDNYQRAEKIVDDEFVVPRMTQRPDIEVGVM
ncbi:hypothetical protein LCGC14_1720950, partial [marine sediment metagenome]